MEVYTKDGWVTRHGHAIGLVDMAAYRNVIAKLWTEHGVPMVRVHDYERGERVFWEAYDTLREARKGLSQACRQYGLKRHIHERD